MSVLSHYLFTYYVQLSYLLEQCAVRGVRLLEHVWFEELGSSNNVWFEELGSSNIVWFEGLGFSNTRERKTMRRSGLLTASDVGRGGNDEVAVMAASGGERKKRRGHVARYGLRPWPPQRSEVQVRKTYGEREGREKAYPRAM